MVFKNIHGLLARKFVDPRNESPEVDPKFGRNLQNPKFLKPFQSYF